MFNLKHGLFIFSLFLIFVNVTFAKKDKNVTLLTEKPNWLLTCKKNDPNLNECLHNLFKHMFPYLAKGIPEANIEPFEPLRLKKFGIAKGGGAVTLSGSLENILVKGPSKSIPTYSDMRFAENKFNFGIDLPILDIDAKYNLVGKILVLPLVGNGNCKILLKDVRTNIFTNIEFLKVQDNREVLHVKNMDVKFKIGGLRVKFDRLFNGNKVLGEVVNQFLNENGLQLIGELDESISSTLSEIFSDLMNNIFKSIPTDLWLLDK